MIKLSKERIKKLILNKIKIKLISSKNLMNLWMILNMIKIYKKMLECIEMKKILKNLLQNKLQEEVKES